MSGGQHFRHLLPRQQTGRRYEVRNIGVSSQGFLGQLGCTAVTSRLPVDHRTASPDRRVPGRVGQPARTRGLTLVDAADVLAAIEPYASRTVVLHGHRHWDWIGTRGGVVLCSAPSAMLGSQKRKTPGKPSHPRACIRTSSTAIA
jgi:hypothetical protein